MRGATAELWEAPEARALELYDWQAEAIESLRRGIRDGKHAQVLAAPTGSGKTVMATYLIDACYRKGQKAVFVCDRTALVDQTSAMFDAYGIPHGVIQGAHWRLQPWQKIQIATAQTIQNRGWPDKLDLLVVDECHTRQAVVWERIQRRDCVVVGLSATPFAAGLGKIYGGVVTVRTTRQLIDDGYLSDFDVWSASVPDMTGAKTNAGEWSDREAERRSLPIVGDIVTEYLRHGQGKKFIAFGATIRHCEEIRAQMEGAGIRAALYTSEQPDPVRGPLVEEFRDRRSNLQGLVSVAALAKGFDVPAVEVVILARPLKNSFAEHIQMLGRGLRKDPENPGKRCVILDHAGNSQRFWGRMLDFFANGVRELDDGRPKEKKKAEAKEREPYKCPTCAHVHDPRPMCPMCGHEYPRRMEIEHVPGTLSALTGHEAGSTDDRQSFYSQLLAIGYERGFAKAEGWAAHQFRERYNEWPNRLQKVPEAPSQKTRDWVTAQLIRFRKGRGKGGR